MVNKEIWLWLLLVMLPHNPKTVELVEKYGDVRSAAEAIRDWECELLDIDERQRAKSIRTKDVNAILEDCNY